MVLTSWATVTPDCAATFLTLVEAVSFAVHFASGDNPDVPPVAFAPPVPAAPPVVMVPPEPLGGTEELPPVDIVPPAFMGGGFGGVGFWHAQMAATHAYMSRLSCIACDSFHGCV